MGRNKALRGKKPIVDAAINIIDTEGEESLSIRNLSKVLDVAPMTIYNYLKNIDDVKREVLVTHYNGASKEIFNRLSGPEHRNLSQIERYVTIYVDLYYDFCRNHRELSKFILNTGYSKYYDDAELRHFFRPLEIFYRRVRDKETRMAYHLCEELVYMMLRNQVEGRDVLTKEEMEYRARFIVKRVLLLP